MELLKKNIVMMRERESLTGQQFIEEDPNVPDSMPDVERIVEYSVDVRMEEIQVETDKVKCEGYLLVQIFYIAENQEHSLQRMETKIPFQEWQAIQGISLKENVQVKWSAEDVTVRMINSRKLSVRTLMIFTYGIEEANEVQTVVEMHGAGEVSCKKKELELLHRVQNKKDIIRLKEEVFLNSSKPDIGKILWKKVQLRSVQTRLRDGKLEVKGELFVFVLYEGDDEGKSREWIETLKPFQTELECEQCRSELIGEIAVGLDLYTLEAESDDDGEKRKLLLEATIGLNICFYQEEHIQILEDVYTPTKELIPIREKQEYESLLTKHNSQVRVKDRVKISGSQPRMMQTCSGWGEVKIDTTKMTDQGFVVEGAVLVRILYVSSDDRIPYSVLEGVVPFQHVIETGITASEKCRYRINVQLEQLSSTMIDSEELEIKVVLETDGLILKCETADCIVDIEENDLDMKKLQSLPGMVGYIVQPGDTLWEIAKKYYTTPERICRLNQIKETDIKPGAGLIILKTV